MLNLSDGKLSPRQKIENCFQFTRTKKKHIFPTAKNRQKHNDPERVV